MSKKLKEMDSVYDKVISKLPKYERLTYCEQLIDRAQKTLMNNKRFLNKVVQEHLTGIIRSAQREIKILEQEP